MKKENNEKLELSPESLIAITALFGFGLMTIDEFIDVEGKTEEEKNKRRQIRKELIANRLAKGLKKKFKEASENINQ